MKTIVIAGSEGLIGKAIVESLRYNYNVVPSDPRLSLYWNLSERYILNTLFELHDIVGLVNCAYPRAFEPHCSFFMNVTSEFAERMKEGSIVNLASIYGIIGPDDSLYDGTGMGMPSWYTAAKAAIIAYSRCLAVRYAPKIRINCVSPGGVFDNQDDLFVGRYVSKTPMGRMATPEDVAKACKFLISEESSYITGQNLIVDGGITGRI